MDGDWLDTGTNSNMNKINTVPFLIEIIMAGRKKNMLYVGGLVPQVSTLNILLICSKISLFFLVDLLIHISNSGE